MGLWQSIVQGLSDAKKTSSPADVSHKTLLIELAILAILVLCLPFVIWWIWGCINNFGRWKVTDNSKTDRKHYIKTWHGFAEREKVDRRKDKRKEVRDKFRSMFVWKTTRVDYSWMFWDPDGSKKEQFEEERNSTWLRHLPVWMRSRRYGSLGPTTRGDANQLGDAEKGLIQTLLSHDSDEIRPSRPFDVSPLHETARVSSWQVDGIKRETCTTGVAINGALNDSSTTISTIRRRQLPSGTSPVFAAESAETNRAVQSQLFESKHETEQEEASVLFCETSTTPKSIASLSNVTSDGCVIAEEHIADHELLYSGSDAALQLRETSTIPGSIKPAGYTTPEAFIALEQHIADNELLLSSDDAATQLQEISTLLESNKPPGNVTTGGCITAEEHITGHELLTSCADVALQEIFNLLEIKTSSGNVTTEGCITAEDHIAHKLLSPCDGAGLQETSSLLEINKFPENAITGGSVTTEEHIADHALLSTGDAGALKKTFTLSGNTKALSNITLCESDDQDSSMHQSTLPTFHHYPPPMPTLINGVIRLSQTADLSPEAADRLEEQLKSALAEKSCRSNAAGKTESARESNTENTTSFMNLAAWKTRAVISLDTSSQSSHSSLPSGPTLCRPRPRPTTHVGSILHDLRSKHRGPSRVLGVGAPNHWSTLENPEVEQVLPSSDTPVRSHHPTESDTRPRTVADMIRKFRESSLSYRREPSHSHISTINKASEADAVEHCSPPTPVPSRTYGSIRISKIRNRIRAASAHFRKPAIRPRRTPASRATEKAAVEVVICESDSAEWELDWDPEAYERISDINCEEELVVAKRGRGRDSLSNMNRQMVETVMKMESSGRTLDEIVSRKSSGRTIGKFLRKSSYGMTLYK